MQDAYFRSATFMQDAYFRSATFTQAAYFSSATFTQAADFRSATFEGPAKFVKAKFGVRGGDKICVPIFTETAFAKLVSFREAEFVSHYPVLDGTEFRETVVVTAKPANWPDKGLVLLDEVAKGANNVPTKEVAKESCASLRHALAKQGMPEEEHFFFRREMRFASQIGSRLERLPYQAFGWFSNFGQSLALPVRALGEVFFIGMVALFGFFVPTLGWLKALGLASAISFSNLLPLFGFGRTFLKDQLLDLPWALQFLSSAQTVVALLLLFFLGLALRKRFRLR
jgi:hypothetical protein